MTIDNTTPRKIHQGRNIKRFREILGIKQETLAIELDVTQAYISKLEAKEDIEEEILQKIAKILNVPSDAIKNFDEDQAVSIFSNTVNNNDNASGNSLYNFCPTFNPVDKIMELFERLLESEKEKTQLMKDILDRLKQ
ncbi:helix-turn-helix transcriptional regulator [Apibacter sp. wkB309]|uniref:helix-turn-helix transcriptional regulator n=1 Tax=Apibacter sp. wkB309 TaxID=1679467 RepID=UPI000CF8EDDF|nr:helix-turn-helix transcriptional regulator [Apibacter sp. wkB309]PQL89751.1 transcriptional regulator [Apibacter sp. wkB309]